MTNEQQSVKDWMLAFGQECPDKPTIPSFEVRKLRAKLILEEALETCSALGFSYVPMFAPGGLFNGMTLCGNEERPNLEQILDGCEDLKVVTEGTLLACGLTVSKPMKDGNGIICADVGDPHFNEVMRSNWSKLWSYNDLSGWGSIMLPWSIGTTMQIAKKELRYFATMVSGNTVAKGKWLVKNSYGKVIKSPSYSPPKFEI